MLTQLEAEGQLITYQVLKFSSENCWVTEPATLQNKSHMNLI